MDREKDVIDLHEWAPSRIRMAIMILPVYFPGSEEKNVIDRVECESQYLTISFLYSGWYIERKKIHA